MMKIVLLLALTVAVYSFPKERSLPSLIKSISKRSLHSHSLFKRSASIDIFDKFDTNHDGFLTGEEMATLFYVYGFPAPEAELFGFNQVEMFDLDGDQLLSRWEFTRNEEETVKPFFF
ncbi:uncharacterized protein LOC143046048 [Mytilus galloprovincialis]|nr:Hypothetical predicted protein [Mytilus galloprovincialis]